MRHPCSGVALQSSTLTIEIAITRHNSQNSAIIGKVCLCAFKEIVEKVVRLLVLPHKGGVNFVEKLVLCFVLQARLLELQITF